MNKAQLGLCCGGLLVFILCAHADNRSQVKTNLQNINTKISQLHTQLRASNSARAQLKQQIQITETQQAEIDQELKSLEQILADKNKTITNLNNQMLNLNIKLKQYQNHLARHVRAWQRITPTAPINWILHPETASELRSQSMYQQYLLDATHKFIRSVYLTQSILNKQQAKLKQEIILQTQAQTKFVSRKQLLTKRHNVNKTQLSALNFSIKNTEETLKAYQKNQRILATLLGSLEKNSVLQTDTPLTSMRNKLIQPIQNENTKTEKYHQGVVFFAPEGAQVQSIYPGKIVFADWLNGYGYLVIIDHGWGFMSLYANNKLLLKHKGNVVHAKEQIALVGHSGAIQKNGLYFELRHHGKAISPEPWWETRSV